MINLGLGCRSQFFYRLALEFFSVQPYKVWIGVTVGLFEKRLQIVPTVFFIDGQGYG